MEFINLELRNAHPFEHFKSIRFTIEFPSRVSGYLIYLRQNYVGYDVDNGDDIDNAIINTFKGFSSKAEFSYQVTLLTTQQYEHCLRITQGGLSSNIHCYFLPLYDYNTFAAKLSAGELKQYPLSLKINFLTTDQTLIDNFYKEYIIHVPGEAFNHIRTLKSIP